MNTKISMRDSIFSDSFGLAPVKREGASTMDVHPTSGVTMASAIAGQNAFEEISHMMDPPLSTIKNLWKARWGDAWVPAEDLDSDWEVALRRLRNAHLMETYEVAIHSTYGHSQLLAGIGIGISQYQQLPQMHPTARPPSNSYRVIHRLIE